MRRAKARELELQQLMDRSRVSVEREEDVRIRRKKLLETVVRHAVWMFALRK